MTDRSIHKDQESLIILRNNNHPCRVLNEENPASLLCPFVQTTRSAGDKVEMHLLHTCAGISDVA